MWTNGHLRFDAAGRYRWDVRLVSNATPVASVRWNGATAPDFGIPDSDIQFAVNSLWNALANA